MIKLIALDLDGTLLNSEKELSPANEKALRDCIAKGIYIVPATGRTVDGIPNMILDIPGVRYAITANGAMVEDLFQKKVIDHRLLTCQQALEILHYAESCKAMYDPYIERRGISEARFMDHLDDYGLSPQIQQLVRRTRDTVPNIIEHVKTQNKPVEKINLFFGDEGERQRVRKELEKRNDIVVSSSLYNNLEINAVGATKGDGILRLASYLNLKPEETMAFGDGGNDYSMIQKAGIGVAMGNGEPGLKEIADYVTLTNDEDGVAAAIEKLVLQQ